jgi:DNA-binding NtrC family response regulator
LLNNKIVSIVDDELDIALLFCDALRTINGIQVFRFTNPILALEHLKINAKDYMLIISDLRMPIVNGLQILKTVKDLNSKDCKRLKSFDKNNLDDSVSN